MNIEINNSPEPTCDAVAVWMIDQSSLISQLFIRLTDRPRYRNRYGKTFKSFALLMREL